MALATLSIDLVAQLAKMQEGLDKAYRLNEKTADQIERRWNAMQTSARALGAALAGAFAGVSLVAFTRETINALDALNDAKDATGATIENLSALEDVARRNGGTLDDVTGILVKFNGALKEADGKNGISQALKAIGLNADELRKMDPAEAVRQVAVALSRFEDNGNKARLVQELFGKSIREAAPFLKDLAESGQLNATVTTEQAEQAERFNKQLAALRTNAGNVARSFTGELLPSLNKLLEALAKLPDKFGAKYTLGNAEISSRKLRDETEELLRLQNMATSGPEATRGSFAKRVEEQRAKVEKLSREAFGANQALKDLLGTGTDGSDYSNEGRNAPKGSLPDFLTRGKDVKPDLSIPTDLQDALKRLENTDVAKIGRLNDEILRLQDLLAKGSQDPRMQQALENAQSDLFKLQSQGDSFANLEGDLAERSRRAAMADNFRRTAEAAQELQGALAATPTAQVDRLNALLDKLRDYAAQGGDPKAAGEAIAAINEGISQLRDKGDDLGIELKKSMGTELRRALKGDYAGILQDWEDLILNMLAKALDAELLKALFGEGQGATGTFGDIFKMFGALFGGASAKGNVFSTQGLVPFATGGVVNAATLFGMAGGKVGLMGEAGPEAIVPLRRGRDGRLGVAGGGGINLGGNVYHIGEGVSMGQVQAAINTSNRAMEARLMRLRNEGRF